MFFRYITFRSFGAGVTAFLISIILGGVFIKFLTERQFKESIRDDGPATHLSKAGTPTHGRGVYRNCGFILLFTLGKSYKRNHMGRAALYAQLRPYRIHRRLA